MTDATAQGLSPTSPVPAPHALPAHARAFYRLLARIDTGVLTFHSPEGTVTQFRGAHEGTHADLAIADWGVASEAMRAAEIGLAEAYRDQRLCTSNLTAFLQLCTENSRALESAFYGKWWVSAYFWVKHVLRRNSRAQAKKNISAHYDLSNDFYARWLDSTMSYSSAIFAGDETRDMVAAQTAKYERILAVLSPPRGATILEIGCGWGGFAEYAAKTRGVHVTGITLSSEQLAYANARMTRAGLNEQVNLQLIDYRDVRGEFDFVVSIEMFEAVGEAYWMGYFETVRNRLKPNGRAVIQTITIAESAFPRYRASSDFIREFIFPGGMLAPITRFIADAKRAGLGTGEPYRFGLDYAHTLRLWLDRVNEEAAHITTTGFDEKFLQIWRFYLCYCEAGFRAGRTDVMQIELTKSGEVEST